MLVTLNVKGFNIPLVDSNNDAAAQKSLIAADDAGVKMKKDTIEWFNYQRDHRTGQEFVPFVLENICYEILDISFLLCHVYFMKYISRLL